ncbi:O-antigen ligase family protein [Cerasicoccus fimbriatus]|uniref:O-antigen ligase family protein n=1 Tax=Cerasicoccus fimbriatus TaxID=3014554 RepID=UPI0022B30A6B|nr:O-antigen ligase family protein [Cerasicoccus sp. TK19100]
MRYKEHESGSMPQIATQIAIGQASILIVFSSWALGGRYPGCGYIIALIGLAGLIPLIKFWSDAEWEGFKGWLIKLSPWIALIFLMLISWLNPMYNPEISPESEYILWQPNETIPFLPICYNPMRTQEYIAIFIGCMITGASVFTVIRDRKSIITLLSIVAINGVLLAVIGGWFKLSNNPKVLGVFDPVNPLFYASFRYYNHWVAYALLCLGAALTVAEAKIKQYTLEENFDRIKQRWDIVWVAISVMIWISIPLSGSRSGLLFAALFITIAGIHLAFAYKNRSSIFTHLSRRSRNTLGISLLVTATILGGIGANLSWDFVNKGIEKSKAQIESGEIDQRFYASPRDCWHMFKDRPIWGWGLGSYAHVFYSYAGPEYRHELGKIKVRNEYAHNDWMQYLVEFGAIGFALLISIPSGIIFLTIKHQRKNSESYWIALSVGLFLTFASFDFPFGPSAGIAIFFVCFAACARLSLGPKKVTFRSDH